MKKGGWILIAGFMMVGSVLLAEDDPYKGWTKDQLKAEITKLKKQIEELRQKTSTAPGDYSAAPTPSGADGVVKVDDFETDHPSFGTSWWEGCDQNKMGTIISPDPYARIKGGSPQSPGYCAGLKGHMGPNEAPWPWATLTLGLGENESPVDLTAFKAIRFYAMGDGKVHWVALQKISVKDYADFRADFTSPKKWTQTTITFDQFAQPDWGAKLEKKFNDVKSLAFTPGINDADYDIKIDDVEFLK